MNNHKIIIPSTSSGTPSRIQNSDNSQFVDTASSYMAIDLNPSLSGGGGGSETGRFKVARNFFELYAEKIHTNPNFKYKYQIETQSDGSISVVVEDTILGGEGKETYSFDFVENENPNQVVRMKELQDAVDTIADMLGVL